MILGGYYDIPAQMRPILLKALWSMVKYPDTSTCTLTTAELTRYHYTSFQPIYKPSFAMGLTMQVCHGYGRLSSPSRLMISPFRVTTTTTN